MSLSAIIRSASFLFTLCILTTTVNAAEADSAVLRNPGDHVRIFGDRIEIGRTYTKLYIAGDALDELDFRAFNSKKEPLAFAFNESDGRYEIDYLELPIMDLSLGDTHFRITTELVQVDWPGNEINWRMVPMLHLAPITVTY